MTSVSTALWIRKNMLGASDYSDELQRPLTEPEIRVRKSMERLNVPDWYLNYSRSKPLKILRNSTPFECRPSSWKNLKLSKKDTLAVPHTSSNISINVNDEEAVQQHILEAVPECWYCEEYDDYEFPLYESQPQRKISTAQIHINGFTFPRCTPSKKIENINIVLDPPRSESLDSTEDYNHLESSDVDYNSDSFNSCTDNSNRSESPYTRFRNSRNKSIELEKIVQNNANLKSHGDSFVRQMVLALERGGSFCSSISDRDWEEQNSSQYLGSNSSSKSGCYLTEDGDLECECGSSEDGELHWGSLNQFDLPRSSSAISIMNRTGRSPALSPIRSPIFEKDEDQIMVKDQLEKIARKNGNSKFSTLDSGYSDDMQSHNTSLTSEKPSIYSPEVESFIKSGPPVMRSFFV